MVPAYFCVVRKKKNIVLRNVTVEAYAAEGKSLARQEGKVVFIEKVVPGDVVDVQVTKSKKDWAEGHPIFFHSFSKERVEPFCQHFGVCGGCQWQMLPYEQQLVFKQQQVMDNLTRIGKVSLPPFEPIAGAQQTGFYRNKLEYTFSTKEYLPPGTFSKDDRARGERSVVGFHAKGFFDKVVAVEKCWLQDDLTNAIRNTIRDYAYEKGLTFYDIRAHVGFLRTMQVRICTTGEVMVNIVLGDESEKKRNALLAFVQQAFPQITTLLYTINVKMNDSMHDLDPQVYAGPGYVIEQLEDFRFKIGPKSFFQTNTAQGAELYRITREFAALDGSQVVYDLYCGTGSIGIFCSRGAKKIVGVEMIAAAIDDARENAALNGIAHTHFAAGDVIEVCDDAFFATHGRPDVIITDPPRAGMHEKLVRKILDMEAPIVVYVSCNPATQARDLALLDEKYAVTRVRPVDMFPHTHHIENVVQLTLKSPVT
ncbi:MAG: methyltransferase [Flaviaesturariibacter sp.]|nr:methyltransferase [Flaviaesturariibacter sp.]